VDDKRKGMKRMIWYAATGRCMCCGWPLAKDRDSGCVQGDCSFRPAHSDFMYDDWRLHMEILKNITTPRPKQAIAMTESTPLGEKRPGKEQQP